MVLVLNDETASFGRMDAEPTDDEWAVMLCTYHGVAAAALTKPRRGREGPGLPIP